MVKIAIAGGTGQVAREVIDALLAAGHDDIIVLSRTAPSTPNRISNVYYRTVDYGNQADLINALNGVHTVLSFVQLLMDADGITQKKLIDAAMAAGVRRFAPSEYGSASTVGMPWWAGKESTREYLRQINSERKMLEYTLFQPGLFLNYLAFPHKTSKHIDPLQSVFDFQNRRAIVVDGYENAIITLTTASDLAAIIVRAIDDEHEWPEVGGISGNRMTFSGIIKVGEKIRGRPFVIEKVTLDNLEAGVLNTSWALEKKHHAVPDQAANDFVRTVSIGMLISCTKGAWDISDEFNQRYPSYEFEEMENFLAGVWKGKD